MRLTRIAAWCSAPNVLDTLHVTDFKGIRDLEVSLRPLTVFVGPNGSGKTTLLEAVYVVGMALRGGGDDPDDRFDAGRWERGKLIREGAAGFSLRISTEAETILFESSRTQRNARVYLLTPEGRRFELAPRSNGTPETSEPERALVGYLTNASRVRLATERIAAPAVVASGVPTLRHDGLGLPMFLQYLHGLRDGTLDRIEAAVRSVVPRFRRVQFRPTALHEPSFEYHVIDGHEVPVPVTRDRPAVELFVEFDDNTVVSATHASEGTLLTLAILALAHAPGARPRRLILIDDLDRALHPSAQHRLIEALYTVVRATPDLQILATTHSPDLADACDAVDVRVLAS